MKKRVALIRQTEEEKHERMHVLFPKDWEETTETDPYVVLEKLRVHQDVMIDWQTEISISKDITGETNAKFFDPEDYWEEYQRYILDLVDLGWDFETTEIPEYFLLYRLEEETSIQSFNDLFENLHKCLSMTPVFLINFVKMQP